MNKNWCGTRRAGTPGLLLAEFKVEERGPAFCERPMLWRSCLPQSIQQISFMLSQPELTDAKPLVRIRQKWGSGSHSLHPSCPILKLEPAVLTTHCHFELLFSRDSRVLVGPSSPWTMWSGPFQLPKAQL